MHRTSGNAGARRLRVANNLDPSAWLHLAGAPIFALMALWTALSGDAMPGMPCPAAPASALDGMTMMYALMAVFHAPAWLKLVAKWREGR